MEDETRRTLQDIPLEVDQLEWELYRTLKRLVGVLGKTKTLTLIDDVLDHI